MEYFEQIADEWRDRAPLGWLQYRGGRIAIARWLEKHGIKIDEVCEHKPPAMVYIDDRAIRFEGNWSDTMTRLGEF